MAVFYDTHAHLDFPDFADDLEAVIERAATAGITRIICIGTDLASSARAVSLAERHAGLFATVGWHPGHATEAPADIRAGLRALAVHRKVVAIGEIGLDFYRLPSKRGGDPQADEPIVAKQRQLLDQQLEVAADLGLNCVIHQRDCFEEVLAAVRPFASSLRCVFHCFGGGPAEAARVLEIGSLVSYTGILTFKNAEQVREGLKTVPAGRFMLETDCPYLAPVPHRGKRCEPAYVSLLAERAAVVRGVSWDQLSADTCAAAHAFFPRMD